MYEFINNGAHPHAVETDPDFRALIDHLTNNGQDAKSYYQCIGRGGVTTEEDKFHDLKDI